MRADADAPVDTMGCERLADPDAPAAVQRFQVLVSLMLSSQTKDEVTYAAMGRLRAFGCTPDRLAAVPEEALQKLIYPVGFYRKKAETLRLAAQRCLSEHGGDIPPDLPGLLRLKGVGPKMAHIAMTSAWGRGGGIGVDVHVHRVANRLRWVGRSGGAPPMEGKLEGADRHGTAPVSGDPGAGAAAGKGCPPGLPRGSGPAEAAEPSDASCAGPVVTAADVAACSAALAASPHHQDTRNPEETRAQLEEWLPRSLWPEVNLLLVGFGQTPAGLALTMKAIVMALAVAVAAITASAEQAVLGASEMALADSPPPVQVDVTDTTDLANWSEETVKDAGDSYNRMMERSGRSAVSTEAKWCGAPWWCYHNIKYYHRYGMNYINAWEGIHDAWQGAEKEARELQAKAGDERKKIGSINNQITRIKMARQALEGVYKGATELLRMEKVRRSKLAREAAALVSRAQAADARHKGLNQTAIRLQKEIERVTKEAADEERRADMLAKQTVKELEEAGAVNGQAAATRIQLSLDIEEDKDSIKAGHQRHDALVEEVTNLERRRNETIDQVEALHAEYKRLVDARAAADTESQALELRLTSLQAQLGTSLDDRRAAMEAAANEAREQAETEQEDRLTSGKADALSKEQSFVDRVLKENREAASTSTASLGALSERRQQLMHHIAELSNASTALREKKEQLEHLHDELHVNATMAKEELARVRRDLTAQMLRQKAAEARAEQARAQADSDAIATRRARREALGLTAASTVRRARHIETMAEGLMGFCDCSQDVNGCDKCGPHVAGAGDDAVAQTVAAAAELRAGADEALQRASLAMSPTPSPSTSATPSASMSASATPSSEPSTTSTATPTPTSTASAAPSSTSSAAPSASASAAPAEQEEADEIAEEADAAEHSAEEAVASIESEQEDAEDEEAAPAAEDEEADGAKEAEDEAEEADGAKEDEEADGAKEAEEARFKEEDALFASASDMRFRESRVSLRGGSKAEADSTAMSPVNGLNDKFKKVFTPPRGWQPPWHRGWCIWRHDICKYETWAWGVQNHWRHKYYRERHWMSWRRNHAYNKRRYNKAFYDRVHNERTQVQQQLEAETQANENMRQATKEAGKRRDAIREQMKTIDEQMQLAYKGLAASQSNAERLEFVVEDLKEERNADHRTLERASANAKKAETMQSEAAESLARSRQHALKVESSLREEMGKLEAELRTISGELSTLQLREESDTAELRAALAAREHAIAEEREARATAEASSKLRDTRSATVAKTEEDIKAAHAATEAAKASAAASLAAVQASRENIKSTHSEMRTLRAKLERTKAAMHAASSAHALGASDASSVGIAVRRLQDAVSEKESESESLKARLARVAEEARLFRSQMESAEAARERLNAQITAARARVAAAGAVANKEAKLASEAAKERHSRAAERDALAARRGLVVRSPLESISETLERRQALEHLVGGERAESAAKLLADSSFLGEEPEAEEDVSDLIEPAAPAPVPEPVVEKQEEDVSAGDGGAMADQNAVDDIASAAAVTAADLPADSASGDRELDAAMGVGRPPSEEERAAASGSSGDAAPPAPAAGESAPAPDMNSAAASTDASSDMANAMEAATA
ncbi:hypothetical protein FNF29_01698 [Cafeteria roenbergensis]|uniref:DNA-(apurinic or apyrimidinic site) lyase n=1 Tax=Cafeteria roenbergensis TaxID=33653 RepID=A0A5A8CQH2_CAFRO|nr:hypothetical protein FNF29_01698 [Cafeteria roenbergensis]|eukprot:KAA0155323.1 hypothetical protein FNF29_01698 [Cafeteria roenbergensis]